MTAPLRPAARTGRLYGPPFPVSPLARRPEVAQRLGTMPLPGPTREEREGVLALGPWHSIWALAWPLVLSMVLSVGNGIVDTAIAGRLGPTEQATVGLTLQVVLMLNALTASLAMGCQVFVSRYVGAADWPRAARAAQQSILAVVYMSALIMLPIIVLAPVPYILMGADAAVVHEGSVYLSVLMLGLVPMNIGVLLNSVFKARGTTQARLASAAVEAVVWLTLSLLLGLYMGWGLVGLALAFVGGKVAGCLVAGRFFARSRLARSIDRPWRVDVPWMRKMLRVGLPAGVQTVLRNFARMAIYAILALMALPADAMAAYAIGFRVESLIYLPLLGLNLAAATLVGQNLGAGRRLEAIAAAKRTTAVAVVLATACGFAFVFGADPIASAFTNDPLVWAYTVDLLQVLGYSLPFLALGVVLTGVMQGAGDTEPPMLFTLGSQVGVGLPGAYYMSGPMGWGPTGVWWAIALGVVVQAALTLWWVRRGSWLKRAI